MKHDTMSGRGVKMSTEGIRTGHEMPHAPAATSRKSPDTGPSGRVGKASRGGKGYGK